MIHSLGVLIGAVFLCLPGLNPTLISEYAAEEMKKSSVTTKTVCCRWKPALVLLRVLGIFSTTNKVVLRKNTGTEKNNEKHLQTC